MEIGASLGAARNIGWAVGLAVHAVRWVLGRRKDTPIFGVEWRFYDDAKGNAVGSALFQRTWKWSVRRRWVREKARTGIDVSPLFYGGTGYLKDRKLVLNWAAEDRPDTFGVLFLTVSEDCREMRGYTIYAPQDTGATEAHQIVFKRVS